MISLRDSLVMRLHWEAEMGRGQAVPEPHHLLVEGLPRLPVHGGGKRFAVGFHAAFPPGYAFAFDGPGDDRERPRGVLAVREVVEGGEQLPEVMAVNPVPHLLADWGGGRLDQRALLLELLPAVDGGKVF